MFQKYKMVTILEASGAKSRNNIIFNLMKSCLPLPHAKFAFMTMVVNLSGLKVSVNLAPSKSQVLTSLCVNVLNYKYKYI